MCLLIPLYPSHSPSLNTFFFYSTFIPVLLSSSDVVSLMSFKLSQSPALLMSSHLYRSPVWQLLYLYTSLLLLLGCSLSWNFFTLVWLSCSLSDKVFASVSLTFCWRLFFDVFVPVSLSWYASACLIASHLSHSPLLLCFCFTVFYSRLTLLFCIVCLLMPFTHVSLSSFVLWYLYTLLILLINCSLSYNVVTPVSLA